MFERRLKFLLVLLALATVVLIVRAFAIQVVNHAQWVEESASAMRNDAAVDFPRGRILDRKGRTLALDQPCIDACVDYRAVSFDPDPKWIRAIARERLVNRVDKFSEQPLEQRRKQIDDEQQAVQRDIEGMWRVLAKVANVPFEEMEETRRQIIRRVETRRRIVWYNKYERAQKNQETKKSPWYAWLLGDGKSEVDIDKYQVSVIEERQAHTIVPNLSHDDYNHLARDRDRYPGLVLRPGVVRTYPYGATACHVIGQLGNVSAEDLVDDPHPDDEQRKYVASDVIGRSGLEKLLEPDLRGKRGRVAYDANGDEIEQERMDPAAGQDVKSTIDVILQADIERAFTDVTFQPDKHESQIHMAMPGGAVVIDIPTGEIRALASYPTFDLNKLNEIYPELVADYVNRPLTNRATLSALEPGSTVKPVIGLGAITDGLIGPMDTIHCDGHLVLRGVTYSYGRCWTMTMFNSDHQHVPSSAPHPTGDLTFADALERSCNVFHETLGDKLGLEGISKWYSRFGLGRPTGSGLAEARGRLPNSFEGPAAMRPLTSWFASIGQGQVAATPIQMSNVAATIARNGIWMRPTLTPRTRTDATEVVDLHLNPEGVRQAKIGMTNVVNGPAGTGASVKMEHLLVAAKTGTAQSSRLRMPRRDQLGRPVRDERGRVIYDTVALGTTKDPNTAVPWYRGQGPNEDKIPTHSWMIGFAPADNPKIAFAVMVEYGGGGGVAAGSVVTRILESCIEQGYLAPR